MNSSEKDLLKHLMNLYSIQSELHLEILTRLENRFIKNFKTKIKKVFYNKEKFYKVYEDWLEKDFVVNLVESDKKRGRPSDNDFLNSSISSKRRKLIEIENKYSEVEIAESFLRTLRITGKKRLTNKISFLLQSEDFGTLAQLTIKKTPISYHILLMKLWL